MVRDGYGLQLGGLRDYFFSAYLWVGVRGLEAGYNALFIGNKSLLNLNVMLRVSD